MLSRARSCNVGIIEANVGKFVFGLGLQIGEQGCVIP